MESKTKTLEYLVGQISKKLDKVCEYLDKAERRATAQETGPEIIKASANNSDAVTARVQARFQRRIEEERRANSSSNVSIDLTESGLVTKIRDAIYYD